MEAALNLNKVITPEMPLKYFRPEIKSIIDEIAKVYGIPTEYVVGGTLAAASTMLGFKTSVTDGKHVNNPRLWIAIIGPSGLGKSDALSLLLQPVFDKDSMYEKIFKKEKREWKENGSKGDPPVQKQLYTTQTTWEGFTKVLAENPNGVMLYTDELITFLNSLGKYSNSKQENDTEYLNIRDGRPTKITRKGEDPMSIPHPFMVLIGGIQPEFLPEAITERKLDNGFAERILYIYPDKVQFPDWFDATVSKFIIDGWNKVAEKLMNAPECRLEFSDEAKLKLVTYYNELQSKKRDAYFEGDAHKLSMAAKFQINVEELVCVIHYLCSSTPGSIYELPTTNVISGMEMDCAIEFMGYFETQFLKVLKRVTVQEAISDNECIKRVWDKFIFKNKTISQNRYAEILGMNKGSLSRLLKK